MALIPVFAIMLVYHNEGWALAVFTIAGVSDGIDGFVARQFKQESELGTIIDPIADKLLMTTAFIILSIPAVFGANPPNHLPVEPYVTIIVIGRDVLIIAVAGAINVMTGFRGFQPSWLGKASTFVQVVGVIASGASADMAEKAEIAAAAEKIAKDLEERFDLAYAWEGDHIVFERPGDE